MNTLKKSIKIGIFTKKDLIKFGQKEIFHKIY